MICDYITYLSRKIPIALLIVFISLAYISIVALYIPVPEDMKEELIINLAKSKEEISNISDTFDLLIYMLKQKLYLALYIVIPLIGPIIYVQTMTTWAWSLATEIELQNLTKKDIINTISHPLLFIDILAYSILIIESNIIFINIVITRRNKKHLLYHVITMFSAIVILSITIVFMII